MWPLKWRLQCEPFHHRLGEKVAGLRGFALTEFAHERIVQMTNRLVRSHFAPTPLAVGAQLSQPIDDFRLISLIGKRLFHNSSINVKKII